MKKNISPFLWLAIVMAVLLLIAIAFGVTKVTSLNRQVEEARAETEEVKLNFEQQQLTAEFNAVSEGFAQYEDQAVRIQNDSILAKYNAAKNNVEQLKNELQNLKNENKLSRKRIDELTGEIGTLRGLLRHYIAQIDSLSKENGILKAENAEIRTHNEQLTSQVQDISQRNEQLNERMTLAEKLNVTGVSLNALQKNGKNEKNVTKAKQLVVTFTIPQNNSTPVGNKTIYVRITNPEGSLLGSGGSFSFEGRNLACTARKTIEYSGNEVPGIRIYWDVNTTLTPGDYTVELFTDGYRLASRHFTLKK